jgi:hypothetical protein
LIFTFVIALSYFLLAIGAMSKNLSDSTSYPSDLLETCCAPQKLPALSGNALNSDQFEGEDRKQGPSAHDEILPALAEPLC